MESSLSVPESLRDLIAYDASNNIVYTDRRSAGNPLLLSWQERIAARGTEMRIIPTDADTVARLRTSGMRVFEHSEEDQIVRDQALDLIQEAAAYGASDLHLMMRGGYTEIQIVVKGELRVLNRLPQAEGVSLGRAIYQGIAQTRDASYNPLEFQNAQIPGEMLPPDCRLTSIRIVRGPCYPQGGEFMTLRLQYGGVRPVATDLKKLSLPRLPEGDFRLGSMGYSDWQVKKLRKLMAAPNGIVIFTGPTGSGKTTVMAEALREIARSRPGRRLVTIEDPVEYPMEWAVQMAVTGTRSDAENGVAFLERLRVALRMAPNIILIGELRGPEVAVSALEAAVTGHQVWTTMHVTDPFLFVDRLGLMDGVRLNRRVFCDHKIVRGVVAQRLLPRLCPHCSVPLFQAPEALPQELADALATWGELASVRLRGEGCNQCGGDGVSGRFAVAEVVTMDAVVMRDFIESGSEAARKKYRARPDADPSMIESAIMYALGGTVDPRAVEDCVDIIEVRP
jgi:type II secretory ATPase GspE/PulE/Tfp pilus assembly ATPase PilB-like protein